MNEEKSKSESKEEVKKPDLKPKVETPGKMAVILLRGLIGVRKDMKDTLLMLRLRKKHTCVILEKTDSTKGMVKKVKDYVTYGEVDDNTIKELKSKRGDKPYFELAPPKGGFERKGIKKPFNLGGALGYRGEKISKLIQRMI